MLARHWVLCTAGLLAWVTAGAADCNGNGVEDTLDVSSADLGFEQAVGYGFGLVETRAVLNADLNGDGDLDFVAVGMDCPSPHASGCEEPFESLLSVLLASGDGTFAPPARWYLPGGAYGRIVAVDADVDGDLDVAVEQAGAEDLTVFINSGEGSFPETATIRLPSDSDLFWPLHALPLNGTVYMAADLDRDGRRDFVIARSAVFGSPEVLLLRHLGQGTFAESPLPYDRDSFWPVSGLPVDLNGDGALDVVLLANCRNETSCSGRAVLVFLNDGAGGFTEPMFEFEPWPHASSFALACDLDGDGAQDLVAQEETWISAGATVLWGRGDGTFDDPDVFPFPPHGFPGAFVAGDFDGDGSLDLAVHASGGISILFNRGGRDFEPSLPRYAAGHCPRECIARDLDHDGDLDLALLPTGPGRSPEVLVLLNGGGGTFRAPPEFPIPGRDLGVVAADLDGDGLADLAASGVDGVSVLRNRGERLFHPPSSVADGNYPHPIGYYPYAITSFADLDGDGDIDLVLGSGYQVHVLFNDGTAVFPQQRVIKSAEAEAAGHHLQDLDIADLDRDGALDVTTAHQGGSPGRAGVISIAYSGGAGSFGVLEPAFEMPFITDELRLTIADVDRDGATDIAAAGSGLAGSAVPASYWFFLSRSPDGSFRKVDLPAPREALRSLTTADVDRDGFADLVGLSASAVEVLLHREDGAFESLVSDVSPGIGQLTATDLDQDGDSDLAGNQADTGPRSCSNGRTLALLNGGDGAFEVAVDVAPGGTGLAAANLDDDGWPDIALAHSLHGNDFTSTGGVAILWNSSRHPSPDNNHNGIPDECDVRFHRGDPNSSGTTDISDGISVLGHLFAGKPASLTCAESADANNDGTIDISDGIYLLSWLFMGGPEPVAPGPTERACGVDPDEAGSQGDLGCAVYPPCQ